MSFITDFLDKHAIPEWREAPSMVSVWCLGAITSVQGFQVAMMQFSPTVLSFPIPFTGGSTVQDGLLYVTGLLGVVGFVGRFVARKVSKMKVS